MRAIDCCEFGRMTARHRWDEVADFMSDNNGTTYHPSVRVDPILWPDPKLADTLSRHIACTELEEPTPGLDHVLLAVMWHKLLLRLHTSH